MVRLSGTLATQRRCEGFHDCWDACNGRCHCASRDHSACEWQPPLTFQARHARSMDEHDERGRDRTTNKLSTKLVELISVLAGELKQRKTSVFWACTTILRLPQKTGMPNAITTDGACRASYPSSCPRSRASTLPRAVRDGRSRSH